jgi:copper oxidase (laccase) domain-containing protein
MWPKYIREESFSVPHAFSTRACGNMKGAPANQAHFLREVIGAPERRAHLFPENGRRVRRVWRAHARVLGDALIIDQPDLALTMHPADCPPIFLADQTAGLLALVHGARVPLQKGVLQRALEKMTNMGAEANRVEALVGPGIRPCCYVFPKGHAIIENLASDGWGEFLAPVAGGISLDLCLDLCGKICRILQDWGVPPAMIRMADQCTCCYGGWRDKDRFFFSSRRSELTGEPEHRFMAVAWLEP